MTGAACRARFACGIGNVRRAGATAIIAPDRGSGHQRSTIAVTSRNAVTSPNIVR
jgi:hypothetical protein